MGHLHQYGTEFLIVDDAHDLSLDHLMLLKEVTDQGRLQYDHPLGLCLVAAGRGDTIPLKETFDLPDPTWLQFRRRFDKLAPFLPHCQPHLRRSPCHPGYPGTGVPAALSAAQLAPMDQFDLRLAHASSPRPDPLRPRHDGQSDEAGDDGSGMVVPGWRNRCARRAAQVAAELLVLRHDTLKIIDGAGPDIETDQAERAEPVQESETTASQVSSSKGRAKDPTFGLHRTGSPCTISEEGGDASRRIGQMHVFWGRAHRPPAF